MSDTDQMGAMENRQSYQCQPQYPQNMLVQQILGEDITQKTLEIHVHVPLQKPAIEQIIDVLIKDLEITSVDIIPNKVIVRGTFEVKALYVACHPCHPVNAVELHDYHFTADVDIPGARRGMEADASVLIEFVDYDCADNTRAKWYKEYDKDWDYMGQGAGSDQAGSHYCDDEDECGCQPKWECNGDYVEPAAPIPPAPVKAKAGGNTPEYKCTPCPKHKCTRDFDVTVVLRIGAKVMVDREIVLIGGGSLPYQPKG